MTSQDILDQMKINLAECEAAKAKEIAAGRTFRLPAVEKNIAILKRGIESFEIMINEGFNQ